MLMASFILTEHKRLWLIITEKWKLQKAHSVLEDQQNTIKQKLRHGSEAWKFLELTVNKNTWHQNPLGTVKKAQMRSLWY